MHLKALCIHICILLCCISLRSTDTTFWSVHVRKDKNRLVLATSITKASKIPFGHLSIALWIDWWCPSKVSWQSIVSVFEKRKSGCPGYDTKLHLVRASSSELWGEWSISSQSLLPGPLWFGMVEPVTVLFTGYVDRFEHYLY